MATSFSPFDKLCHRHHLARHANYRSERISSRKRAFPQPCFVTSRQKEVTRHRKTSSLQLYDCGGEKPLLPKFVESECRSDAVQSKKTGAAKLPSLLPACTLPQVLCQNRPTLVRQRVQGLARNVAGDGDVSGSAGSHSTHHTVINRAKRRGTSRHGQGGTGGVKLVENRAAPTPCWFPLRQK